VELDDEGKILKGGYYFGEIELPVEGAEIIKKEKSKIGSLEIEVVEFSETDKVEYRECEKCFPGD